MAVYDSAENYSVNESGLQSPRSMIGVEAVLNCGILESAQSKQCYWARLFQSCRDEEGKYSDLL